MRSQTTFDDIRYDKQDGIATITINRPKVLNAFRSQTVDEMVAAFQDARADRTIGGGHVLHFLCDLTIAADTARFGQVGPWVGSVDPGFGTAYLTRVVGEKKAREIWYLCRQYSAADAEAMGLVNKVVPAAELMNEARAWAREILDKSPTAIKIAKASFNAETDHIRGISALGMSSLALYYGTEEAMEGRNAFLEKRKPDFQKYRR